MRSYIQINSQMERERFLGQKEGDFMAFIESYLERHCIEYKCNTITREITAFVDKGWALEIKKHFGFEKLEYFNGEFIEIIESQKPARGRRYVATDSVSGKSLTRRGFLRMVRVEKKRIKRENEIEILLKKKKEKQKKLF